MNRISQIKLEREDKRIKLTLSYNSTYIKKIKTIPGYYWHPDKKYWSFPYSEDIFKKILSLFDGENIHKKSSNMNINRKPKLLEQVRIVLRTKHYSIRTEESYLNWIKRFIFMNQFYRKLSNKQFEKPGLQNMVVVIHFDILLQHIF